MRIKTSQGKFEWSASHVVAFTSYASGIERKSGLLTEDCGARVYSVLSAVPGYRLTGIARASALLCGLRLSCLAASVIANIRKPMPRPEMSPAFALHFARAEATTRLG